MNSKFVIGFLVVFVLTLKLVSPLVVDSEFITVYPGEEGKITIEIENNENFDIEDLSIRLLMENLPFTSVGSSEKNIDELDEDDDDTVSFKIRPSTDIVPGDYNIPYEIEYTNVDEDEKSTNQGSFGIRVSAKTEIDFGVDTKENAIVDETGKLSLEIINKGLGEIKSVSVEIFPEGYELLSKDKIFIGTISADDTDIATFDVIYETQNPSLKAKITYKDFDNNEKSKTISLPFKVYSQEEALELGIINKSNTGVYIGVVLVLIIIWIVWRRIKKNNRKKKKGE